MKRPRPGQKRRRWCRHATGRVAARFGQDKLAPARHFERSTPRESQQQQAPRIAAIEDQMSHPVGEHLGLAGTGAGGDQQCRRRFDITADAVFDGAALFRVETVQMPRAIGRLQLRVPFSFARTAITSARLGRSPRGSVGITRRAPSFGAHLGAGFSRGWRANRACGLRRRDGPLRRTFRPGRNA
jgi:hypothetical protein